MRRIRPSFPAIPPGAPRSVLARVHALALALVLPLAFTLACSVHVAPVVETDSEAGCPGGSPEWRLQIVDQRADKKVTNIDGPIRDSIVRSLPGCRWSSSSSAPEITIEVHRFRVALEDMWEAGAEWSVIVRDRDGGPVTEFQTDAHVSRPNYSGVDNEKACMQQALEEAIRRTLTGLRSVTLPR
jgi:hypothetical protein